VALHEFHAARRVYIRIEKFINMGSSYRSAEKQEKVEE